MKKVIVSSRSEKKLPAQLIENAVRDNIRECPSCQGVTLSGMPGGRDATCRNCGYKDPCCYD